METTEGAPAPAATPAPAAVQAAPPAAPAAAPAPVAQAPAQPAAQQPPAADPAWLKSRLTQAERAAEKRILTELGVPDLAQAKAALTTAATAPQTDAARAAAEEKLAAQSSVLTSQAERMMAVLTTEQQAAVKKLAGDDPVKLLDTIQTLADSGLVRDEAPPVVNTAPAPTAPASTSPASPPDHRSVYEQTKQQNPFAAALYGLTHAGQVYVPRQ